MRIHITNPNGFIGQYIQAEAALRGYTLSSSSEKSDILILCGWHYSNAEQSLLESQNILNKFDGKVIIGIGSQAELWDDNKMPVSWKSYASSKRKLSEIVLNSNIPIKSWIRLSAVAGRNMSRGRLVLDALNSRRSNLPLQLKGTGNELISICDVKLIAKNIMDIPKSGTHIINGWGERYSVSNYLTSWNVKFHKGEDILLDTPSAFDSKNWNGWLDVQFSPASFEELLSNYTETQEIV